MMIKSPHINSFRGISSGGPAKNKQPKQTDSVKRTAKSSTYGKRIQAKPSKRKLPVFTPWKVALACFVIGICGILYINHIFSTQAVLQQVNRLEGDYNKAKRIYNEQRLNYDRLTGPKEIYQQARLMGFVNAGPADQILIVKPD
ncbi:MAG: hypothetical protein EA360_05735 [Balneolaceae bacterium]|nr:MAG: hypothetical protein EA360_05735 [Balneolaceae bacterium]